jgi:hypothetical protein
MGYDVSYHPITAAEMKEWYFDLDRAKILNKDYAAVDKIAARYKLEEFYEKKYRFTLDVAAGTKPESSFDTTHGYYIAVIQGFFRRYFYTRGSAISFLINEIPQLKTFTLPWEEILGEAYPNKIVNGIETNYSSGVFIPAGKVITMLDAYDVDPQFKALLDGFFSHGRIDVFLKALRFARGSGLGLLEATEVVEPNPLDPEKTKCYSDLANCDRDGITLYREAALAQLREIEKRENLPEGHLSGKARYMTTDEVVAETTTPSPTAPKKNFFQRLFGK